MKMPVSWHKERLANSESSLVQIGREIQTLQKAMEKAREEQAIYREQIKRAEAEGCDGFDRDRFGVKRAKQ